MAYWRSGRTQEEIGLGVSTLYLLGQHFSSVSRAIRKHNVGHWELFDDSGHGLNQARVKALRTLARRYGHSYSVHAPICDLNLATLNSEVSSLVMARLSRSMRNASSLGAKVWVLHPGTHGALSWVRPGEDRRINISNIRSLKTLGSRLGVKMLLENISAGLAILGRAADFRQMYRDWSNAPSMTLDVGHACIRRETGKYLHSLSNRVEHVHAHDNDGVIDKHMRIGAGKVDWKLVTSSLIDSGFKGEIVVESVSGPFASLKALNKLLRPV